MKIQSAEFVKSCKALSECPKDSLLEVAFTGRSNVGKSSLLNALLHRKNLAKVSGAPGKTRLINFFRINNRFNLVDLPGYGYAKTSQQEQKRWGSMLENYLIHRSFLRAVVLLVDGRVGATVKDLVMKDWLESYSKPFILVATKIDKVSRGNRSKHIREITQKLSLPVNFRVIPVSSRTGEGLPTLWAEIWRRLHSS